MNCMHQQWHCGGTGDPKGPLASFFIDVSHTLSFEVLTRNFGNPHQPQGVQIYLCQIFALLNTFAPLSDQY